MGGREGAGASVLSRCAPSPPAKVGRPPSPNPPAAPAQTWARTRTTQLGQGGCAWAGWPAMARRSTPALVSRRRAAKFPRTGFPSSLPPRPASHPPSTSLPPLAQITSEEEVAKILPLAKAHGVPVTFRAAGTSLSGQVRGFQHRGRGRGGARGGDTNAVARCLRRAGRAGGSGPGQPLRPPPRPRTWPSRRSEAGWGQEPRPPARPGASPARGFSGGGGGDQYRNSTRLKTSNTDISGMPGCA